MITTGLDHLLAVPERLAGRRWALLTHAAAVTAKLVPAQLALARSGVPPSVLFAPEHGLYGVEQDMVPAVGGRDPLTGLPIRSLYGDSEESLRPSPGAFEGLDLLVVDLQDVGARYYTYAATAVWTAEAALAAGCEVWVLDRPNPLGGEAVEGNLPQEGFASFVGAFRLPVRHGLTLGELVRLEARRRGWLEAALEIWTVSGWRRSQLWPEIRRPWIAPSPNMPSLSTALLYPGACLVEATGLSEGRGTTRPFRWIGAPGVDAGALADLLVARRLPGVHFLPVYFRPQFHKHRSEVCAGVETIVTDPEAFLPYRTGVELLAAFREVAPAAFSWREAPYEFVADRPAVDLLTGSPAYRLALESGRGLAEWIASWEADEERFRDQRRAVLLYPEDVR